jgi:hypothetical protein
MIIIVDFSKKSDKERLYETLKGLRAIPYQIELKEYRDNRSNRQNRYYWGVVLKVLSDYTGFTQDEMHEELKKRFLSYFKVLPTGEEVKLTQRTANLNTEEFERYLEKVRMFAAQELDVVIPLPNEFLEV